MNAILASNESGNLPLRKVAPEFLESFEAYPHEGNRGWSTVSIYMHTLRVVYNRTVDRHIVPYVLHHFRYVYTGTRAGKKRALEKGDMERLTEDIPKQLHSGSRGLQRARGLLILTFLLRGMPSIDLAYLRKHGIGENVFTYCRRKIDKILTMVLLPEAVKLVKQHMNTDPTSPYLLSLISSKEGVEKAYKEYQLALRSLNYQLMILKQVLGLTTNPSSYIVRHTWATMTYYREVYPGVILEATGHSSITVTETYLEPFKDKKIDEANAMVFPSSRESFSVDNCLN